MNWEERPAKAYARHWLLNQIKINRGISYLGLPAANAIFEKMLCKAQPVSSMVLVEQDPDIFSELKRTITRDFDMNCSITMINGSIDDVSFSNKDFVWLDYCGPVTPQRVESLQRGIKDMKDDGVLAVTFMAGREKGAGTALLDHFDGEGGIEISGEEASRVPSYFLRRVRAISRIALNVDPRLRIKVQPYSDRVPMALFVFQKTVQRPTIEVEPYYKE